MTARAKETARGLSSRSGDRGEAHFGEAPAGPGQDGAGIKSADGLREVRGRGPALAAGLPRALGVLPRTWVGRMDPRSAGI